MDVRRPPPSTAKAETAPPRADARVVDAVAANVIAQLPKLGEVKEEKEEEGEAVKEEEEEEDEASGRAEAGIPSIKPRRVTDISAHCRARGSKGVSGCADLICQVDCHLPVCINKK